MSEGILEGSGGLGLFLLGMFVMTEGLKELAGGSLRTLLRRFTRSPASGAATGAVTTAIIQSSSATTLTAVGFVGAGLLTFGQALGIIFGANIGTTMTGWFVALFGFRVPLGTLAFPILFGGALLRLFGRGRSAAVGQAVAGFGMIFIGIDLLQSGLAGLEGEVTPETFPPDTWFGRVQLVGIGVAITLVTQSSSAGVALALAAVSTGTISFAQAAAVVIGMDIGTTVTAALAAVGGGTQAKRTGVAHVVYNVMTGVGAFFLLPVYVRAVESTASNALIEQPELFLVGFHTLFNGLGVIAVIPVADRFAALIERLVPEPEADLTGGLGRSLLSEPDAALDVVEESLRRVSSRGMNLLIGVWKRGQVRPVDRDEMGELDHALSRVEEYALEVRSADYGAATRRRHEAAVHTVDHLRRLTGRLQQTDRLEAATAQPELRDRASPLMVAAESVGAWLDGGIAPVTEKAELVSATLNAQVRPYRSEVISLGTDGMLEPDQVEARLDAMRWLARLGHHVWRLAFYLERLADSGPESVVVTTERDAR